MKRCSRCKEEKPFAAFNRNKRSKTGRRSRCRECERKERAESGYFKKYYAARKDIFAKRSAASYQENKEARKAYHCEYQKRRRTLFPEANILTRVKARAKRKGIPFNLMRKDIYIPEQCPVLGIPISCEPVGRRGGSPNSPSIDRINPNLGYVRGNVRIVSNRANTLKNDATIKELELVLEDLRKITIKESN